MVPSIILCKWKLQSLELNSVIFLLKKTGIKECACTPSKVPYRSWINKENDRLYIRLQSYHLPVKFLPTFYLILTNFPKSIVKSVILPPWRNRVKKLKTQSRRDSETQRNFKTLSLCDFASLHMQRAFSVSLFCGKKEKKSIQKRNPLWKIVENLLHTSSVPCPYQLH